jgi:hypothetical protein
MTHRLHIQGKTQLLDPVEPPDGAYRDEVQAWLSALLGAEHVSLLIGSGLGLAVSGIAQTTGLGMGRISFEPREDAAQVDAHATATAAAAGRGEANIEDQIRSALQLLEGLRVLEPASKREKDWTATLNAVLSNFAVSGLAMEREIREAFEEPGDEEGTDAVHALASLLLAFAGRPPSRERLNVFTTNYDRLIEFGADVAGLRVLDRFVGSIEPVFRSSRLDLDMHYNPPGIRGEPRHLEGVLRLSKLHGSLDWRYERDRLRRLPLGFGGNDPDIANDALGRLMIYPNAAKDVETLQYPYAELFRDLASALCRPNSVLFTYGYGFGDDHINRTIADMLTLSSTHLAVIAYGDPGSRIENFVKTIPEAQYTLLVGDHYGDLATLVTDHLPQLGSDALLVRDARRRQNVGQASPRQTEPPKPNPFEDDPFGINPFEVNPGTDDEGTA